MATPDQVQKIRSVVDTLTKTPIDALVSNQQKWGAISFESARRDLDAMFGLGRHIKEPTIKNRQSDVQRRRIGALIRSSVGLYALRVRCLR